MELTSLSLSVWYHILLALSVELGLAAAGLAFVGFWVQRRWSERCLVLVLVAAYVWMILMARSVQVQGDYWRHYLEFVADHYPPASYPLLAQQTQHDYHLVGESTNRLGWTAVLAAQVTILFGGVLLVRWCAPHRRDAKLPMLPAASAEDGELDITIEPLGSTVPAPREERLQMPRRSTSAVGGASPAAVVSASVRDGTTFAAVLLDIVPRGRATAREAKAARSLDTSETTPSADQS